MTKPPMLHQWPLACLTPLYKTHRKKGKIDNGSEGKPLPKSKEPNSCVGNVQGAVEGVSEATGPTRWRRIEVEVDAEGIP